MTPVDEEIAAAPSPRDRDRLTMIEEFLRTGSGYNIIHATRPQTIGYGLEDSPSAQLTWVVDKVEAWTDDPLRLLDPDYRARHLASVLLTWLTRTATSTASVVYAAYPGLLADPAAFHDAGVPTGVFVAAEDPSIRHFAELGDTIVRWTEMPRGGHFAPSEQPDTLHADLCAFVCGLDNACTL